MKKGTDGKSDGAIPDMVQSESHTGFIKKSGKNQGPENGSDFFNSSASCQ